VKRLLLLMPMVIGAQQALLEPVQPVLAWIYPAGGQRGTTVEVTASGTAIAPQSVLITGGGVTARVLDAKDPAKVRIAVAIAPDAEPGVRELRILNAGGASNRARFAVGQLPEINEVEPNSEKSQAQNIAAWPVVVNGQILEGDRDYFRFSAKADETVVCAVEARSLRPFIADAVPGWFDPVLAVYDAGGRQLQFADDYRFRPDPVMFFRAPKDGLYTLEVRDVIYRGRGDFVYRLTIGAEPPATHYFPPGETGHGDPTHARRVVPPVAIDGRIGKPAASDYFVFTAKQGEKLVMQVLARRFDSPLDSILTLYNARNQQLAENDDWNDPMEAMVTHQADSRLLYTFPTAGDYFLRLRDVQGKGGEEYGYRLVIVPPQPDFALRITPDNPRLGQGDTAAITVSAVRKDEFNGDIKLAVEGLPAGFEASEALIPAGQAEGRLTITAPPDAPLGILSPTVTGSATVGKDTVVRKAEAAEALMQAFAYTHILPTKQLFLAVIPPAAFTLAADVAPGRVIEVKQDSDTPIAIKILRQPNAKAGVSFGPIRIANGTITSKSVFVAADKNGATVVLTVTKAAKAGLRQDVIFSGVMRVGNQTITRFARAIPIQVVAGDTPR
jgi:hypothetical protein